MLTQPFLPLPRPSLARSRLVRRPFHPSAPAGPYGLPRPVQDRLASALAGFRNRDAAFALAVMLARFWSAPARLVLAFPIDRRALADRADLGLTEAQVRGAIGTLNAVGFLDRAAMPTGSRYKATASGLHRRPILWQFGADYVPLFTAANTRAKAIRAARQARSSAQRSRTFPVAPRSPVEPPETCLPKSPKSKSSPDREVLMGDLRKGCRGLREASPAPPDPGLEAALARLGAAIAANRRT